ncbi:hypothetical protein [Saccharopolyspora hattusasensis]|uniref:hypothetical protein n=1 Tax=Saccharopolyspora hattusasensis TaxID=1128679 RepID=UPI003D964DBD
MRQAEAERLAGGRLHDGADLWRDGLELSDVLAEDGTVDPDRVRAAADELAEAHPHWRRGPKPDPSQGYRGGVAEEHTATWSGLLRER